MSVVEVCSIANSCVSVFEKITTDSSFHQFWAVVEISQQSLDVSEAVLPRQRKRPRRYQQ